MRPARTAILLAWLLSLPIAHAQVQVNPLLPPVGHTSSPNLSPDGKTLAFEWCKPDYSCGVYTRPFAGGDVALLTGMDAKEGLPFSPRWSPNGAHIAFVRMYSHFDNHLILRDFRSGAEHDLGLFCDSDLVANWSPDGRFLIASVHTGDLRATFDCRLMLFSGTTGARVREEAAQGSEAAFSPNGRMLAYADGDKLLLLRLAPDATPAGRATVLVREPRKISGLTWVPDGKEILYQVDGDVAYFRRLSLTPGSKPRTIAGLSGDLSIAQILRNGDALATETTQTEALWRLDLTTKTTSAIPGNPGCFSGEYDCSPDGHQRAYIATPTGTSEIWLANSDGTNGHPLVRSIPVFESPHDDGVPILAGWSPDGQWLAFTVVPRHGNADIRSYLYVISTSGGAPRQLGEEAYGLDTPTWSPDSKSLIASRDRSDNIDSPTSRPTLVRADLASGKLTSIGAAEGMWPQVARAGNWLYFFTQPRPKLSRTPIGGGTIERLWNDENLSWFCYAVGTRYLYLFQQPPRNVTTRTHTIIRFDPETHESAPLAEIPFEPKHAFLSADEQYLYFEQQDDPVQRVVLVRGLL